MSFLLIAHRGANRQAPENTLEAFQRAVSAGCDGSECDVQLSRDGILMVFHDERLQRLAGRPEMVPALLRADLQHLHLNGPGAALPGERCIPTLDAVWQLHEREKKWLFVELKYFNEIHTPRERLGLAVLRFVQTHRPGPRFHAISFDAPLLQWLKARAPSLRTGLIFNHVERFAWYRNGYRRWADAALPRVDCVTAQVVAWAKTTRTPLYPWVADDARMMTRVSDAGAAGVMSNEPQRLVAWAKHRGRR